jgi:hypothetical protein
LPVKAGLYQIETVRKAVEGLVRRGTIAKSRYPSRRGADAWVLTGEDRPTAIGREQSIRIKRENRLRVI